MARYKPQDRNSMLLPVVLSEQIVPGSFAFALDYLVDNELDLTAMDAKFKNDDVGASAYDPRVMLKIVLLAYSQGLISSRTIEQACLRNVQFIAISGDSQPSHTHIAKFVCSLSSQIKPLFRQVLMTCDAQGLIGREMFAIDGVKLPSNASKERSGTHEELRHRAKRLDQAAEKILAQHQAQDKQGSDQPLEPKRQAQMDALRKEAKRTREFLATTPKRIGSKGKELKSNVTDPQSAKMATSKGVMQGYAAQAAVDSANQVIIAADVVGSGSEQAMLLPMIEQASPFRTPDTLVTADAGYHSMALVAKAATATTATAHVQPNPEVGFSGATALGAGAGSSTAVTAAAGSWESVGSVIPRILSMPTTTPGWGATRPPFQNQPAVPPHQYGGGSPPIWQASNLAPGSWPVNCRSPLNC